MNPNEALRNLRDAVGLATALADGDPVDFTAEQILADMTETVMALDGWLSTGGFPPSDWPNPEAIPFDLRLSFTPDAIREHFEGDEPDPTEGMTDEQLTEVGRSALDDEMLYREFHLALVAVLEDKEENG